VLVIVAAGAVMWTGIAEKSLIVEVVKHADRERDVLIVSDQRVADDKGSTRWRRPARTCRVRCRSPSRVRARFAVSSRRISSCRRRMRGGDPAVVEGARAASALVHGARLPG
jgi:hypothetical protein